MIICKMTNSRLLNFPIMAIVVHILLQTCHSQFSSLQLVVPIIGVTGDTGFDIVYGISQNLHLDTIFCLAEMKIVEGATSSSSNITACSLARQSNYACIMLSNNGDGMILTTYDNLTDKIPSYDDKTGAFWETLTNISTSPNLTLSPKLISKPFQQTININSTSLLNKNVRMVSCQTFSLETNLCSTAWKFNYIQMFTGFTKENAITPRHHACGIQNNKEVHVYHGGVIRQSIKYMVIAIVVYDRNNQSLNMWGGIDYSNDHASRDMFCYTSKGQYDDIISFIAGAPYKDVNQHVKGVDDTLIISNSYISTSPLIPSSHYIQYYRKYVTGDFQGDEDIIPRIYGFYGFAAYFDDKNQTKLSCLDSTLKHNFLILFPSYVDLAQGGQSLLKVMLLFAIIVLSVTNMK